MVANDARFPTYWNPFDIHGKPQTDDAGGLGRDLTRFQRLDGDPGHMLLAPLRLTTPRASGAERTVRVSPGEAK